MEHTTGTATDVRYTTDSAQIRAAVLKIKFWQGNLRENGQHLRARAEGAREPERRAVVLEDQADLLAEVLELLQVN